MCRMRGSWKQRCQNLQSSGEFGQTRTLPRQGYRGRINGPQLYAPIRHVCRLEDWMGQFRAETRFLWGSVGSLRANTPQLS